MKSNRSIFAFTTTLSELHTRYREFFESKLAVTLLQHPELFPAVKKVSLRFSQLIRENRKAITELIKNNEKILEPLYSENFFGRFSAEQRAIKTPDHIIETLLDILSHKKADFSQIMEAHSFIMTKLDSILLHPQMKELKTQIYDNSLFSKRGRMENKTLPLPTRQLGITHHPVFCKRIGESKEVHMRACERFNTDRPTTSEEKIITDNIFVAGASGHTGAMIAGAMLFGGLSAETNLEDLQQYALACFASLTSGGNHCFSEVMKVANRVKIPYEANNYLLSIPQSIQESTIFKQLVREFPNFLDTALSGDKFINDSKSTPCRYSLLNR